MLKGWCACVALVAALASCADAKVAHLSNKNQRYTVDGAVVNAHDGNIVQVNGTYFLYGEWYGDGAYVVTGTVDIPKLSVYSSPDMMHWKYHGLLHNNTQPGWAKSGQWPDAPNGTFWSPWAFWCEKRQSVIMWFTASPAQCCDAYWGVAESKDGIHFDLKSLRFTSSNNASLDTSAILIDDDGTGYVAYSAISTPAGTPDHAIFIDRLSDDYLSPAGVQVGSMLPTQYMEGVMLFKRKGIYYLMAGSCCCACRAGSGAVVWRSNSIEGPWEQQIRDVNCQLDVPICAGAPAEYPLSLSRPTGHLTIAAQGITISTLRLRNGETAYLWNGNRWLSGPNHPPDCPQLCQAPEGICAQHNYHAGDDLSYWIPLEFDSNGYVLPFAPFVDEFQLDLPDFE